MRTCDGSSDADEQALPLDALIPDRSSPSNTGSPSIWSNDRLALLGSLWVRVSVQSYSVNALEDRLHDPVAQPAHVRNGLIALRHGHPQRHRRSDDAWARSPCLNVAVAPVPRPSVGPPAASRDGRRELRRPWDLGTCGRRD